MSRGLGDVYKRQRLYELEKAKLEKKRLEDEQDLEKQRLQDKLELEKKN